MTLTPDVEQQLKRIYNKIRDTTSIGVGEPVKFMVQIEMLLGETADASSITGIVPLVHLQHDGATKILMVIGRHPDVYLENTSELPPLQDCGEHYNNPT